MCSEVLESSKCAGCDRKDEDQKTRMLKKLSIGKVSVCRCVSMYVLRPIPGRVACSGLMITSLLQVVDRLDASFIFKILFHKLDPSCFNNLRQVCKYQVASSLISTNLMQL